MRRVLFSYYSGALVALGALVAIACLAGSMHIHRLQANLSRAVMQDAVGMEAALDLQVQLRNLRVHSLVLAADPTDVRREIVRGDLARVLAALASIEGTATTPEDARLAARISADYRVYRENLDPDRLLASKSPVPDLGKWSDAHHMGDLLVPCRQLADRQRQRMKESLERSEAQTVWAGRVLFGLGFAGVLAGLLSGYAAAWALTRRVAKLSIRVQAVQAHLDQEVGAMTVRKGGRFWDLDEQLDRVVERVSKVCRRLQEQERSLLRAEQLAAVGQLAASVAHEVRNPLTGVKLLLQAAVRAQDPTPLTEDRLRLLLQEVARIERTVKGLMDFAQASPPERHLRDIRPIIAEAVNVAQSRAETKSIVVRPNAPHEPLRAAVDHDQLLSLLTNLLFNAIDAAPTGDEVCLSASADPSGMIRVVVSDHGPGIDPGLAGRLFTPFATNKATGTGLGLTIARRVARDHGGELTVADRPEGGACFTLTLPVAEESHAETFGR